MTGTAFLTFDAFLAGSTMQVYGGFFIALSYLWGYMVDGLKIDTGMHL